MGGKKRVSPAPADLTIWHNPRCSKSRQTLELLRGRGAEPAVREYLSDAPSAAELDRVLGLLGLEPRELMRRKEAVYAELDLANPGKSRAELIAAMAANPILIERPVVMRAGKAALGRPPENVLALF